jgi:hypothetical protein
MLKLSKKSDTLASFRKQKESRISAVTDDSKMLIQDNQDQEEIKRTETFYLVNQDDQAQSVKTAQEITKPTVAIASTRKVSQPP